MLFHVSVDVDYAGLGDRRDVILRQEWEKTRESAWRKANGRGVIEVGDCSSNEALRKVLASLPLSPWLQNIDIEPLTEHPLFPGGRLGTN
jgi:muconolactone delta-isomerase